MSLSVLIIPRRWTSSLYEQAESSGKAGEAVLAVKLSSEAERGGVHGAKDAFGLMALAKPPSSSPHSSQRLPKVITTIKAS